MSKNENLADSEVKFNWSILGHRSIVWYLQHSILSGQLNHAYLFSGPSSVGKTSVAECFVSSLLCQATQHQKDNKEKVYPCKVCHSCQQYFKKLHPDIFLVQLQSNEKTGKENKNISIDQIRTLQNKLSKRSFLNSYKVAVIFNAELMTIEAGNSLLKTLEEPSKETIIVLIASDINKIPDTIISRCQLVKFLQVSRDDISKYIINKGVDRQKADMLASLALGCPGVALKMLEETEQLRDYQSEVEYFIKLYQISLSQRFQILNELFQPNGGFISQLKLLEKKVDIWLSIIRDIILIKYFSPGFVKNSFASSNLQKIANETDISKLIENARQLKQLKNNLYLNINPRLSFENYFINL